MLKYNKRIFNIATKEHECYDPIQWIERYYNKNGFIDDKLERLIGNPKSFYASTLEEHNQMMKELDSKYRKCMCYIPPSTPLRITHMEYIDEKEKDHNGFLICSSLYNENDMLVYKTNGEIELEMNDADVAFNQVCRRLIGYIPLIVSKTKTDRSAVTTTYKVTFHVINNTITLTFINNEVNNTIDDVPCLSAENYITARIIRHLRHAYEDVTTSEERRALGAYCNYHHEDVTTALIPVFNSRGVPLLVRIGLTIDDLNFHPHRVEESYLIAMTLAERIHRKTLECSMAG